MISTTGPPCVNNQYNDWASEPGPTKSTVEVKPQYHSLSGSADFLLHGGSSCIGHRWTPAAHCSPRRRTDRFAPTPRARAGLTLDDIRTQGSASLHPGLRSCAASRLKDPGLEGSRVSEQHWGQPKANPPKTLVAAGADQLLAATVLPVCCGPIAVHRPSDLDQ